MGKRRTLWDIIQAQKFKNIQQYKKFVLGKKVVPVTNNQSGHDYAIGEPLVVDNSVTVTTTGLNNLPTNGAYGGGMIYWRELEFYANDESSIQEEVTNLSKEKESLDKLIRLSEQRLNFLRDTKATQVDEMAFRKYMVETIVGGEGSNEEKTTRLCELMDNLGV